MTGYSVAIVLVIVLLFLDFWVSCLLWFKCINVEFLVTFHCYNNTNNFKSCIKFTYLFNQYMYIHNTIMSIQNMFYIYTLFYWEAWKLLPIFWKSRIVTLSRSRTQQIEDDSPSNALRWRCRGSARNTPKQGRYIFPGVGTDSQPVRRLCVWVRSSRSLTPAMTF